MSPENIRNILGDYFPESQNLKIDELNEGLTNYNYRIVLSGAEIYFLKIFRNATMDRVRGISSLIHSLRTYHFPTPEIIPCADGSLYWSNGKISAILTEYVPGVYPEKNATNLFRIGNILGALHQIPASGDLLKGYSLNFENQREIAQSSGKVIDDELLKFIDRASGVVDVLYSLDFPKSIIHGDVFLDNIIHNSLGDLFFIDFEGGCIDNSIFDLSRAVIGCAIVRDRIHLDLTRALVSGYDIVRNLEQIERRYLYEYIIYSGAVSTLWRYNEFNVRRSTEGRKQLYARLMYPVLEFMKISKQEFQERIFCENEDI